MKHISHFQDVAGREDYAATDSLSHSIPCGWKDYLTPPLLMLLTFVQQRQILWGRTNLVRTWFRVHTSHHLYQISPQKMNFEKKIFTVTASNLIQILHKIQITWLKVFNEIIVVHIICALLDR